MPSLTLREGQSGESISLSCPESSQQDNIVWQMPTGHLIPNVTWLINNARPNDSGDYTCWASQRSPNIVRLHISGTTLLRAVKILIRYFQSTKHQIAQIRQLQVVNWWKVHFLLLIVVVVEVVFRRQNANHYHEFHGYCCL